MSSPSRGTLSTSCTVPQQLPCHQRLQSITGPVAETLVDGFEAIKIEEQNGNNGAFYRDELWSVGARFGSPAKVSLDTLHSVGVGRFEYGMPISAGDQYQPACGERARGK